MHSNEDRTYLVPTSLAMLLTRIVTWVIVIRLIVAIGQVIIQ